jgi:formylmethanofuran dehydrogenase subunit B
MNWLATVRQLLIRDGEPTAEAGELECLVTNSRRVAWISSEIDATMQSLPMVVSLYELIRAINRNSRCYLFILERETNSSSLANLLAAQTGFAQAVRFGIDRNHACWDDYDAASMVDAGRIDGCIAITNGSSDETDRLTELSRSARLGVLYSNEQPPRVACEWSFPIAEVGIDRGGDMLRCDDILIPVPQLTSRNRFMVRELLTNGESFLPRKLSNPNISRS